MNTKWMDRTLGRVIAIAALAVYMLTSTEDAFPGVSEVLAAPQSGLNPQLPSMSPLPPVESWGACPIVDEPLGPTYSIGFTPWHLSHDPGSIRQFQAFVQSQKIDVGPPVPCAVESKVQILLDPERVADADLPNWGWKKDGIFLSGSNADDGPAFSIPLQIPRSGLYRLGIRYEGWTHLTGGTRLCIYVKGREADGPVVNEEFYHQPAPTNGMNWHSIMADLQAGAYTMRFSHVIRQWQAPPSVGYAQRKIDYLKRQTHAIPFCSRP